jgi:lysyl-tRNA synthetase class I
MGAGELLELMPPELITYLLIRPDLQENKDVDPTGERLMALYEDLQSAAKISTVDSNDESRADHKRHLAFRLATGGKLRWRAPFSDILMYYQLYRDWEKVSERSGDREGALYLRPFIEKWVEKGFAPEEYSFSFTPSRLPADCAVKGAVADFASRLKDGMDPVRIHNLVFETAESNGIKPGALFEALYFALLGKKRGPRFGKLVDAIGIRAAREAIANSAG